uniref:Uncharacterized protein n=1 Tax=Aegilops tauschii subsp. strangulata TaxID=200361 RepID=A0A452Z6P0_AEGTS
HLVPTASRDALEHDTSSKVFKPSHVSQPRASSVLTHTHTHTAPRPLAMAPDLEPLLPRAGHRPVTGGWRSALFIIWVEVAERFAYYGIS